MNKRIITLLLAILTLFLTSCHKDGELTENGFIDPNTDIEYVEVAPMGLYPIRPEAEYLTVDSGDSDIIYYSVQFEEANEFLCYEIESNYFLVRSTNVKEPNVLEFNPIAATIYNASNTKAIDNFFADIEYLPENKKDEFTVGESDLCKQIANAISENEAVELNLQYDDIDTIFYIRLLSQDYPGLYYLISYFKYNGRCFLRDDSIGKTVLCPNDVIIRMGGY